MKSKLKLIHAMPCYICKKEFLWTRHRRKDFRCPDCRNGVSVEAIEKELKEMDNEEYNYFIDEVLQYEKEHGRIKEEEES